MFRKYYKDANDSIKPDEDFVNSVIRDAKKHKPPLRARYTQYAAVAAAAVVVVTGAVTAFPLLQKAQRDGGEGIVIEERATDNGAAPTAAPSRTAAPTTAPAAVNEKSGDAQNSVQSSIQKPERADAPSRNTSESSYRVPGNVSRDTEESPSTEPSGEYNDEHKEDIQETAPEPKADEQTETSDETTDAPTETGNGENDAGENNGASGGGSSASLILGETDEIIKPKNTAPEDMTPYSKKQDLSDMSAADTTPIDDADIPCPDGYYCIDASPNGYTFKNDDGAVISVTINYGGADREPYITEEDGSIYAVFTSFGLSVTINAYGADMAAVEEIINQFR